MDLPLRLAGGDRRGKSAYSAVLAEMKEKSAIHEQISPYLDRTLLLWIRTLFHFPSNAVGRCYAVEGSATQAALQEAYRTYLAHQVDNNMKEAAGLVIYVCKANASELATQIKTIGIPKVVLHPIDMDGAYRMRTDLLNQTIAKDRSTGLQPFALVGHIGGAAGIAIDPMASLATLAKRERIWLHIEGGEGALATLAPDVAPIMVGIEQADSLTFNLPDLNGLPCGPEYLLLRSSTSESHMKEQLVAPVRSVQSGPQGSALLAWLGFQLVGADQIGHNIARRCTMARYLARLVDASSELTLFTPVVLNTVSLYYRRPDSERILAAALRGLDGELVDSRIKEMDGKSVLQIIVARKDLREQEIAQVLGQLLAAGLTSRRKLAINIPAAS